LPARWLAAQEYLDLWHNSKTDNFYLIQKKFNEYFAGRDSGRGTGYKQFKRWEDFMEPRVFPSGKLINPSKLALDAELRYSSRKRGKEVITEHTGNWYSLGIKSYVRTTGWNGGMGRINCIAPHPTDPQTLFAGSPSGGLWKTTDKGKSWMPLSDGIPVIGVSGIAINPHNPDSIYILTGDGDNANTYCTGVLLSVNGGDTWQSTGLKFDVSTNVRGYKLLMHPTDRRILFAVTNTGIYKTSNGGVSWGDPKQIGSFTDIAFNPAYPDVLYAASNTICFTSFDSGESWKIAIELLNTERLAIGVTPDNPDYVYLLAGSSTGFAGLYKSVDGGQNFQRQSNNPNILGLEIKDPFGTFSQADYDLAIAVSPHNAEEVHAGGINCWKSTDGGKTWTYTSFHDQQEPESANGKYTHGDIHALVFNDNTLYCGSDGGVYFSDDNAQSWTDISSGLEISQFYSIGVPPNNQLMVYGGAQDIGVNKWTFPNSFMDHQLGGDGTQCVVDYTNPNIAYAKLNVTYYVTDNGGVTWNRRDQLGGSSRYITPFIMHPTDHDIVFAGLDPVYKLSSLGQKAVPIGRMGDAPVSLGMSAANPNSMYVALPQSLKLSVNLNSTTITWSDITGSLPVNEVKITTVGVSAVRSRKAWVCFSGYIDKRKVYQTSDGGANWINFSGTLPNVPVNCIVYHNNGQDGIYVGTDIGVFYRDNTLTDWIQFRNGMPNVIVTDLKITENKIRAATHGRGIWESTLYSNCGSFYILGGDVTGYQFYEASDQISSKANIKGGIGTEVTYKAVNQITLSDGFQVVPGSGFDASLGECQGTQVQQRKYRGVYEGVMAGVELKVSPVQSKDKLKPGFKKRKRRQ